MFKVLTLAGALIFAAEQLALPAVAQELPNKQPIKIVAGFNAGGLTDVLARVTAGSFSSSWIRP